MVAQNMNEKDKKEANPRNKEKSKTEEDKTHNNNAFDTLESCRNDFNITRAETCGGWCHLVRVLL
jgi:hypothetical protein